MGYEIWHTDGPHRNCFVKGFESLLPAIEYYLTCVREDLKAEHYFQTLSTGGDHYYFTADFPITIFGCDLRKMGHKEARKLLPRYIKQYRRRLTRFGKALLNAEQTMKESMVKINTWRNTSEGLCRVNLLAQEEELLEVWDEGQGVWFCMSDPDCYMVGDQEIQNVRGAISRCRDVAGAQFSRLWDTYAKKLEDF